MRYIPWRPKVPSLTWRSFLHNHLTDIVAIDMFVVTTTTFRLLYILIVVIGPGRRAGPNRHVVLPSAARGDGEPDRRIAQKRWHRRVTLGLRHLCVWAIIRARSRAIKSCGMPFIDVIKSCIALPLNGLTSRPIRFASAWY